MILEIKVPAVGESISEVTIGQWIKKEGEYVEKDEVICELESDKASFEIQAEEAGTLSIKVPEYESVPIGTVIAEIDTTKKSKDVEPKDESVSKKEKETSKEIASFSEKELANITPLAKQILKQEEISVDKIQGTGIRGKITKQDVLRGLAMQQSSLASSESESAIYSKETEHSDSTRKPMSTLRKTLAKRLVAAKNQTAMLTTFNEIDMQAIQTIRQKYREIFQEKYNIRLGILSFFIKAVCQAIQEWPILNAQLQGEEIVYYHSCHISVAVATPQGLVTPVIRSAETLSFHEIERQIKILAEKARKKKLSLQEMQGGTFTITNGGVFGSLLSTPLINYPQAAILGMHKIQDRPVAIQGEIQIRPMMYVALSYDHRLIDGRESVGFLVRVKEILEDPVRLLLEI